MQAHGTKVQPLSLNSLLEMSKQLKTQIKTMRKQGNEQTEPLMRTQERCIDAIGQAQIDQRSLTTLSDAR
jgi:hypothetical protein